MDALDAIRTPDEGTRIVEDASQENALGRDAFLRIFIAQLEAQDPLNPQDSSQLSAQLAQFSQLEQSVLTTEELRGLGEKLDQLIELSGGRTQSSIEPVSLIGRTVEFEGNELAISSTGNSGTLSVPLPEGLSAHTLLVQVESLETGERGLLSVELPEGAGEDAALAAGDYSLRFDGGALQLTAPEISGEDGQSEDGLSPDVTAFRVLEETDSGGFALTDPPRTFQFASGQRYRFSAHAVSRGDSTDDGEGAGRIVSTPIDFTRSAVVTGVQMRDGAAVLIAEGFELDTSQIKAIRQ